MIRIEQVMFAHFLRIGERRHQRPAADMHFAHSECLGHGRVSVRVHSGRALRADPTHYMAARSNMLASPEIRVSALMLPNHHVNAQLYQQRNQKIARVSSDPRSLRYRCEAAGRASTAVPSPPSACLHMARPLNRAPAPQNSDTMATNRASGKPSPGFCVRLCGKRVWLDAVSGIDTVTSFTSRPRQRHARGCCVHSNSPISRPKRSISPKGRRDRALLYPAVFYGMPMFWLSIRRFALVKPVLSQTA